MRGDATWTARDLSDQDGRVAVVTQGRRTSTVVPEVVEPDDDLRDVAAARRPR